jgi:hypothetical protein
MSELDSDEEWELASSLLESLQVSTKVASFEESKPFYNPKTKSKLLILVDMNGTLLHRSPTKLGGKKNDCKALSMYVYFRNFAKVFCNWLAEIQNIDVCFYTSMKAQSASIIIESLLEKDKKIHLLDQTYNKRDPDGENSWSMMRDMKRIWSLEGCPSFGHSEKTTIMIDDSPNKMKEYPDNVYIIPAYVEEYVVNKNKEDEQVLLHTMDFLKRLLEEWNNEAHIDDIRLIIPYMKDFMTACKT